MTNERAEAEIEAVQAVVDRVGAYQDGAPEGTVAAELRKALIEADITLDADEIDRLAKAIEDERGTVSAAEVLRG